MMKNLLYNSLIWLLSVSLIACEGKFVPDPIDPRIPKYSKRGYDAAGALINGNPWVAVKSCGFLGGCDEILRVVQFNNQWIFSINGTMTTPDGDRGLTIEFVVDEAEFGELSELNDRIITLDGVRNFGRLSRFNNCFDLAGGESQVFFRSVRITQNDNNTNIAVSGTFGFVIESPECGRVEVFQGRFDYGTINDF